MKEYNYPLKFSQDINIMDRELESELCCKPSFKKKGLNSIE